jgi:hypothetical protein
VALGGGMAIYKNLSGADLDNLSLENNVHAQEIQK